ncbi:hypothetical protein AAC387_Pa01g2910 [Persea americana]
MGLGLLEKGGRRSWFCWKRAGRLGLVSVEEKEEGIGGFKGAGRLGRVRLGWAGRWGDGELGRRFRRRVWFGIWRLGLMKMGLRDDLGYRRLGFGYESEARG